MVYKHVKEKIKIIEGRNLQKSLEKVREDLKEKKTLNNI